MTKVCKIFVTIFIVSISCTYLAAEERKLRIGFTLPLSGAFAEFGIAVQNALKLATEDQPQLMNQLEFILEDDQYNAKNALSSFKKLKDLDKVDLVMVWGNEPALSVAPVANNSNFPLIAFGQTPAIAAGRKYVLRVLGPADQFGKPLALFLNQKQNVSVQMLLVDNTFYRLVSDSVQSNLTKSSKFAILASVPSTELDFRPYLLKLRQRPNDYLGVFLSPAQLITFFKQANELAISNPIFGSTSFESRAVISEARELIRDAVYAHVTVEANWHQRYLKRFGDDIQVSYAAVAYDIFLQIAKSVKDKKENLTGFSVLESLAQLKKQSGVAGDFFSTFSDVHGHYIDFTVSLKKVVDGSVLN